MGHSPVNTWTKPLIQTPYSVRPLCNPFYFPLCFPVPLAVLFKCSQPNCSFSPRNAQLPNFCFRCSLLFTPLLLVRNLLIPSQCQLPSWSLFWCSQRWTRDTHAVSSVCNGGSCSVLSCSYLSVHVSLPLTISCLRPGTNILLLYFLYV